MQRIDDRIALGRGRAARACGTLADVFRPAGNVNPIAGARRFVRLHAVFGSLDGKFRAPPGYGDALRTGLFDNAYTQAGDYIVTANETHFVASQAPLAPVLCVRTNRVIRLVRPRAVTQFSRTAYGGVVAGEDALVLDGFPASVLGADGTERTATRLADDVRVPEWRVLLPAVAGVAVMITDRIEDDLGRTAQVTAAELTSLGWRLSARQESV